MLWMVQRLIKDFYPVNKNKKWTNEVHFCIYNIIAAEINQKGETIWKIKKHLRCWNDMMKNLSRKNGGEN